MDSMNVQRRVRVAAMIAASGAMIALGACASKKQAAIDPASPPLPMLPPIKYEPGERRVSAMLQGPVVDTSAGPSVVNRQKLTAAPQLEPVELSVNDSGKPGELQTVKITVKQAGLEDVVRILLGPDGLNRSYVIDPAIMQAAKPITMDIDEEMTRADMEDLLHGIAMLNAWTVETRSGVTYIRPVTGLAFNARSPVLEVQAAFGNEQPVVRIKRMRYLSAAEATTAVTALGTPGGKVAAVGRSVLIVDTAAQANRLSRLLAALDVPAFAGIEVWTYELASRPPEVAAQLLTSIIQPLGFKGSTSTGGEDAVAFVAIPDSSRLMVIARDSTVQSFVHDLIKQIDQPSDRVARSRYIYRAQHADVIELDTMLKAFFADRLDTGGAISPGTSAAPNRTSNGIRIVAVKEERVLLLNCTPDDYAEVLGTLRALDQPKQQVAMTSIIAEVSLTNNLEYGVEYFLRAFDFDGLGILELAGGASELVTGVPTGSAIFTAADGFAVIQALERETAVNILSRPNVTARDGTPSTIEVGGEVPYSEGNIDTTTGGLRQDTAYKKVGIVLTIKPTINESGDVTMEIDQQIADVIGQSELGPEFTTRNIVTTVTVPHGMTLLLGGIIQTETTDLERKIPVLGNIPVAGEAFKSRNLQREQRELLLAITPKVIATPNRVSHVMSDFLRAAQGVAESLRDNIDVLDRGVLYFPPSETPRPPAETADEVPIGMLDHDADAYFVPLTQYPWWTVSIAMPA